MWNVKQRGERRKKGSEGRGGGEKTRGGKGRRGCMDVKIVSKKTYLISINKFLMVLLKEGPSSRTTRGSHGNANYYKYCILIPHFIL